MTILLSQLALTCTDASNPGPRGVDDQLSLMNTRVVPEERSRPADPADPVAGDGRATRRRRSSAGQPQPWLIAEPEELGEALAWMLRTAEGPAPRRVQDLAGHLGISPAQVYNYISGTKVPPPERWDQILEIFRISGPARGEWATAGDRVRERRRLRQARSPITERSQPSNNATASATSAYTPSVAFDPEASRPHLGPSEPGSKASLPSRRLLAASAGGVLVVAVAVLTALAWGRPNHTVKPLDVECLQGDSATTWLNHHSRRYLGAGADVPELVTNTATGAADRPPVMTVLSRRDMTENECAAAVSVTTRAGERSCLTAGPNDTTVRWARCDLSAQQLWIIENHWSNEGVFWKRIRPTSGIDSCLHETAHGSGSASVVLEPCGTDWRQQWNVSTPS